MNDAIEMAQHDRDIVLQTGAMRNKATDNDLKELFLDFDKDENGSLTREEFMEAWHKPEVLVRFWHLGVEPVDGHSCEVRTSCRSQFSIPVEWESSDVGAPHVQFGRWPLCGAFSFGAPLGINTMGVATTLSGPRHHALHLKV